MTQISIFFLNFSSGEQWWFDSWILDATIDCWKNAFDDRNGDLPPNASMLAAWRARLKDFSWFWLRELEKYAHHGTEQSIQHHKEKWCEALSLKSDRPYYVDFSVFDRSAKNSKSRNSEKFSKEFWLMWVIPWNEACFKKQSNMISSGYAIFSVCLKMCVMVLEESNSYKSNKQRGKRLLHTVSTSPVHCPENLRAPRQGIEFTE